MTSRWIWTAGLFLCLPLWAQERRITLKKTPVYAKPSAQSELAGHLPEGTRTWLADEDDEFSKLRTRSGKDLWVRNSDLGRLPTSEKYSLVEDIEPEFFTSMPAFKRIRLDLGGSAGRAQNESFLEAAIGVEYFMMERLSWRNAIFFRHYQTQDDFFGLDTSVRGNGNLPLGPLKLRGIIGAGYRFAKASEGAPLVEIGGFAALKGFDIGVMVKYLHRSISDASRENILIYSVVLSGNSGFF